MSEFATCPGVKVGLVVTKRASAPATCGLAIEVPLIVLAVFVPNHVEVISLPGAKRSTQLPKLEYEARTSRIVVAATVMASVTRAGE